MYESLKKIFLVDLPSLDFYSKLALSLVLLSLTFFLLVTLWRTPTRVSLIDPITEQRLQEGVRSFFIHQGDYAPDIPIVYGHAKDIVRRMKDEKDVFTKVQMEIEQRKVNDSNWKFANELSAGKALVNALGLTHETPKENQIFIQMPLPLITDPTANKSSNTDAASSTGY